MSLIDKQEAIDAISEITSTMSVCVNQDECRGMKRMQKAVIKEITELPDADVGGDLISRQALLNDICKGCGYIGHCHPIGKKCEEYERVEKAPAVKQKPTGEMFCPSDRCYVEKCKNHSADDRCALMSGDDGTTRNLVDRDNLAEYLRLKAEYGEIYGYLSSEEIAEYVKAFPLVAKKTGKYSRYCPNCEQ